MQGYTKRRFAAKLSNGHRARHNVYTKGQGPVVVIVRRHIKWLRLGLAL